MPRLDYHIVLHVTLLLSTGIVFFHKLKARPSIRKKKKTTTHFIEVLVTLWWSGTKPAISAKYTCTYLPDFEVQQMAHWLKLKQQ